MDGEKSLSDTEREFLSLLRKREKDEDLVIVEAKEKPGSNDGDNYMSIIIRTQIKGHRGNGTPYENSLITKRFPTDPKWVAFSRTPELFRNEAYVYQKLLPLIGPFGPEFIYADDEKIILEDLSLEKFSIHERRKFLDLEHCTAVIQTLASFHAKSLSIKIKNPQEFQTLMEPLIEVAYPQDEKPSVGRSIGQSLSSAIKSLEALPIITEENRKAIQFLRSHLHNAYNIMKELLSTSGRYHVLTHGDIWINNILFARTAENNMNLSVKLLDFQGTRHASLATDFHYFMYSSSKASVIEEKYTELIHLYHKTFLSALRELEVPEEDCQRLNIEWFHEELRKYAIYGLFSALGIVHAILANDSLTINASENNLDSSSNLIITDEKTKRIERIISHYLRNYV